MPAEAAAMMTLPPHTAQPIRRRFEIAATIAEPGFFFQADSAADSAGATAFTPLMRHSAAGFLYAASFRRRQRHFCFFDVDSQ